jgi:hypothetical protein
MGCVFLFARKLFASVMKIKSTFVMIKHLHATKKSLRNQGLFPIAIRYLPLITHGLPVIGFGEIKKSTPSK